LSSPAAVSRVSNPLGNPKPLFLGIYPPADWKQWDWSQTGVDIVPLAVVTRTGTPALTSSRQGGELVVHTHFLLILLMGALLG